MLQDIATVVFSHPPIGTVGLTEPEAREEFGDENVTTKSARFPSMLFAFNEAENKVGGWVLVAYVCLCACVLYEIWVCMCACEMCVCVCEGRCDHRYS